MVALQFFADAAWRRGIHVLFAVAFVAGLAVLTGCASEQAALGLRDGADPIQTSGIPADTDLAIAQANFKRGAYGLSEKHYRLAIEKNRTNAEAWLGLAASYDQLRRFDLADRAYARVGELLGHDAVLLNNQGYSQILRGNYAKAEVLLARAKRKDPDDIRIDRNIELLYERQAAAGQ